jgi:hypothetical protein
MPFLNSPDLGDKKSLREAKPLFHNWFLLSLLREGDVCKRGVRPPPLVVLFFLFYFKG